MLTVNKLIDVLTEIKEMGKGEEEIKIGIPFGYENFDEWEKNRDGNLIVSPIMGMVGTEGSFYILSSMCSILDDHIKTAKESERERMDS